MNCCEKPDLMQLSMSMMLYSDKGKNKYFCKNCNEVFTEVTFHRTSVMTGTTRAKTFKVREKDLEAWANKEKLIQDAFPYLTADEREFVISGITPDEWELLAEENEDKE